MSEKPISPVLIVRPSIPRSYLCFAHWDDRRSVRAPQASPSHSRSSRTASPSASSTRHPRRTKKRAVKECRYARPNTRPPTHTQPLRQPRTLEVFHFLGVLPDLRARGAPLKPVVFYKLPGGTDVLETTHLSIPEADTPDKPFVRP